MKKLFSKVKESKGFTLVEMIVVMAIIGILVALLAPNVATLIKDAQDTSNDAKVKNVMTTLSAYNTKMIKDGFAFTAPALDQDFDNDGTNDGCIVTVTSTNFNSTVQGLWFDNAATPAASTVEFVGTSSGYLPANVLNGTETMYLYLTKEGNVLGVCYTDGNDYVKAINTVLALGDGSTVSTGTITDGPLNSSTVRDLKTSDGFAFAP